MAAQRSFRDWDAIDYERLEREADCGAKKEKQNDERSMQMQEIVSDLKAKRDYETTVGLLSKLKAKRLARKKPGRQASKTVSDSQDHVVKRLEEEKETPRHQLYSLVHAIVQQVNKCCNATDDACSLDARLSILQTTLKDAQVASGILNQLHVSESVDGNEGGSELNQVGEVLSWAIEKAYLTQGDLFLALQENCGAYLAFREVLLRDPKSSKAWIMTAEALLKLDAIPLALLNYEQAELHNKTSQQTSHHANKTAKKETEETLQRHGARLTLKADLETSLEACDTVLFSTCDLLGFCKNDPLAITQLLDHFSSSNPEQSCREDPVSKRSSSVKAAREAYVQSSILLIEDSSKTAFIRSIYGYRLLERESQLGRLHGSEERESKLLMLLLLQNLLSALQCLCNEKLWAYGVHFSNRLIHQSLHILTIPDSLISQADIFWLLLASLRYRAAFLSKLAYLEAALCDLRQAVQIYRICLEGEDTQTRSLESLSIQTVGAIEIKFHDVSVDYIPLAEQLTQLFEQGQKTGSEVDLSTWTGRCVPTLVMTELLMRMKDRPLVALDPRREQWWDDQVQKNLECKDYVNFIYETKLSKELQQVERALKIVGNPWLG